MITGAAQCTYLEEVLKWGGAGRRGFYRDGGAIMCGARRAMSGEIGYLLVLTAGVVDFVGISTIPGKIIFRHVAAIAHVILRFETTLGGSRE